MRAPYFISVVSGLLIGGAILFLANERYWPGSDGVKYIQAGTNFANGHGLVQSPDGLTPVDADEVSLQLWPPGYPVAIAVLVRLGMDGLSAALLIAWSAWVLLPAACLFALRPLVGFAGMWIGVLIMLSPGALSGLYVRSDIPFLVLVLLSVGVLFRAWQRDSSETRHLFVMSGILAGLAYSVRNAGFAFFVATIFTFLISAIIHRENRAQVINQAIWWLVGVLPIVAILKIRAILVFGTLEPYSMAPSDVGLISNVRHLVWAVIEDILASRFIGRIVAWTWEYLSLVVVGSVGIAILLSGPMRRHWMPSSRHAQLGVALVSSYVAAGWSMLVAARTIYTMGESIGVRFELQYSWGVLALVWLVLATGVFRTVRDRFVAGGVAFVILLAMRAPGTIGFVEFDDPRHGLMAISEELRDEVAAAGQRAFIVSDQGPLLTWLTGRSVRRIEIGDVGEPVVEFRAALRNVRQIVGDSRPVVVILTEQMPRKSGASWKQAACSSLGSGFRLKKITRNFAVMADSDSGKYSELSDSVGGRCEGAD